MLLAAGPMLETAGRTARGQMPGCVLGNTSMCPVASQICMLTRTTVCRLNHVIRKLDLNSGKVTVVAGGLPGQNGTMPGARADDEPRIYHRLSDSLAVTTAWRSGARVVGTHKRALNPGSMYQLHC